MNRILLFIYLIVALSCTDELQKALEFAGDNRAELEMVLEHYDASGDDEKSRAAEYLIRHMPGHKSMVGEYEAYYDAADSLFDACDSPEDAFAQLFALSAAYDGRIRYDYDSRIITAEYLIRNIDKALDQWRKGDWGSHLDFDEFCEWILPYSCGQNHPLDNWREELEPLAKGCIDETYVCEDYKRNPRQAICMVNDSLKAMNGTQSLYHDDYGHKIYRPSTFVRFPSATCQDYCEVALRVMRSKGIPVGVDFTTQWPNRYYGHFWTVFPNLRGKTTLFNPFSSNPDYPHYPNMGFAKVFRRTYAPNEELLSLVRRSKISLSDLRTDVFFKDVTDIYMETVDLKVPLLHSAGLIGKTVFIAVFNNHEWRPVYWGKARMCNAVFRNMGRNVTYIVLSYKDEMLVPISNPFYVDFEGNVVEISSDLSKRNDVQLWRKNPMYQHVFRIHKSIQGGYIEASDDPSFNDAEIVAELPLWTLTSGRVPVSQERPYRYWRLCADEDRKCDMAEMFFVGKSRNFVKPLEVNSLVDGDPLTNYSPHGDELLDVVDLGEPVVIEEIMYIRRGDGNAIMPGDKYEIYYWHESKWNLHLATTADNVYLDISGLPSGALYYIKGLSRGNQSRIFTWDDDAKEVIWH